ncbi:MAG: DUF5990 family protein [Actinomycetota bacterium]
MSAGYRNIHVGVQRRNRRGELLGLTRGGAPSAEWALECTVTRSPAGVDLRCPYIQGPPGGRFIYLSWGTLADSGDPQTTFTLFRRAKVRLGAVSGETMDRAAGSGTLIGRLGLTDAKGNPRCVSVVPPVIEWSAG